MNWKTDMRARKTVIQALTVAAMPLFGAIVSVPAPENVPELLRTFAGEEVKTKDEWEKVRAPELFERFQKDVYGRRPAVLDERKRISFTVYDERPVMDGKAVFILPKASWNAICLQLS